MDENLIDQVRKALLQAHIQPKRYCKKCGRVLLPFEPDICAECRKAESLPPEKPLEKGDSPTLKYQMPFKINFQQAQVKLKALFTVFNMSVEDFFDKFNRPTNYVPTDKNVCGNCFINDIKDLKHGILAKEWHSQHCKRCLYNYEKAIPEEGGLDDYLDKGVLPDEFSREYPIIFSKHVKDIFRKSEIKSADDALIFYKEIMEIIRMIQKLVNKLKVLLDIIKNMQAVGINKEEISSILSLAMAAASELNGYKVRLLALTDVAINIVDGAGAGSEVMNILKSAIEQVGKVEGLQDKFVYIRQLKNLAARAGIDEFSILPINK